MGMVIWNVVGFDFFSGMVGAIYFLIPFQAVTDHTVDHTGSLICSDQDSSLWILVAPSLRPIA